ncbi:hypothetical protein NP493_77g02035 [Ridgeia piscesae]|uniref:Uncharacterized protein n=1 Tax=Ridgeia piscesae TaxID=27915 RepID=A0AAD9P9A8_RIDPI|nr:hypothetical protein NP493_77g02035 [Ridgeia piscesae]
MKYCAKPLLPHTEPLRPRLIPRQPKEDGRLRPAALTTTFSRNLGMLVDWSAVTTRHERTKRLTLLTHGSVLSVHAKCDVFPIGYFQYFHSGPLSRVSTSSFGHRPIRASVMDARAFGWRRARRMIGAERSVYSEKRTGGDRVKMDRSLPAQANGAALTAVLIGRRAEHMAWMQHGAEDSVKRGRHVTHGCVVILPA